MNLALIEIDEQDIERLNVPFTVYAIAPKPASKKLQAAYIKLAAIRKEMAEQYKVIDTLQNE